MENRTENRSNNCKNQTSNRTSNQTKGADDESAKNSVNSRSAKNSR